MFGTQDLTEGLFNPIAAHPQDFKGRRVSRNNKTNTPWRHKSPEQLASDSSIHVTPLQNVSVPLLSLTSSKMSQQGREAFTSYRWLLLNGTIYVKRWEEYCLYFGLSNENCGTYTSDTPSPKWVNFIAGIGWNQRLTRN